MVLPTRRNGPSWRGEASQRGRQLSFLTDIVEIRGLQYPILRVESTGVEVIKAGRYFYVTARAFYEYGEVDESVFYDSEGLRCSTVATRIYDLSPLNRFLRRADYFFLGDEWKTAVRAEIDCTIEARLSFAEVREELSALLLEKRDWWYDLTEEDIRGLFDNCKTIADVIAAAEIVGLGDAKRTKRKSKIFTDLTEIQRPG